MHSSDVGIEVGLLSKQRRTKVTLVWLLTSVYPLVVFQPIGRGEFFVANLALELVFPCVQNDVVVQLSFPHERGCAIFTLERLLFCVMGQDVLFDGTA